MTQDYIESKTWPSTISQGMLAGKGTLLRNLLTLCTVIVVLSTQAVCSPQKTQYKNSAQQSVPKAPPVAIQQPQSLGLQPTFQKTLPQEVRIVSTPLKDGWDKTAVCINGLLALVGIAAIFYAAKTLGAVKRQADTMDRQTAHMARDLVASQRPWISPTATLSGPLKNYGDGPFITVDIRLENVGHTPAVGIEISPVMHVLHASKPGSMTERKRLCNEIQNRNPEGGQIVFPGKTLVQRHTFGTTVADVETCKIRVGFEDRYAVQIIICVAYRSTFDDVARYYTGVIYDLTRFEPTHPNAPYTLKVAEELSTEGLRLSMSAVAPILAQ